MRLLLLAAFALPAVSAQDYRCGYGRDRDPQHGEQPALSQCDTLFKLLASNNSVAGWRNWCVGDYPFKCCVSWTRDCSNRRWVDALAYAHALRNSCGRPGFYIYTDIDPCFGRLCLSNNGNCH